MAYNTPETVADYLARFQMEITHRGKGTFTPDHVKYSLTIASGGKDFFTTFESNPHVHGEPTITQVFGALASDAMVVRDYGMDEFVDEFCDGMKPSAAIRAYNSCKETYDWMRDGLYLSNGDIASLSEVISENEDEVNTLVEKAASERAARYAYDHPKLPKGFVTIEQLQGRYLQDGSDGAVRVLQVRPLRPSRGYLPLRHPRPAKGYGGLCHPGKPCRRNLKRPLL